MQKKEKNGSNVFLFFDYDENYSCRTCLKKTNGHSSLYKDMYVCNGIYFDIYKYSLTHQPVKDLIDDRRLLIDKR